MRTPRKPSAVEWSVCIGAFVAGAGLVWLYFSDRSGGNTPEKQLVSVEGVASNVTEYTLRGHHLNFTVGPYAIEYDGAQPKYQDVRSAVQSRRPIRVSVAKGRSATLYKLNLGAKEVLTYSESANYLANQAFAVPIVGGILMALGAAVTAGCFYTQRRYAKWVRGSMEGLPDSRNPAPADERLKKVTWISIAISVAVYAIVIGVNFAPEVRAKLVQAYGPQPLGIPIVLLVGIVETVLFLPVPWVFWHIALIAYAAHLEGKRFSPIYVLLSGGSHPHLRRSQLICFGGLLYFAMIAASWIFYAASRGI